MVSRRVISSYKARYSLTPALRARLKDVTDAVDIHAHARGSDEEEPLDVAKQATAAGMAGVVFKSISPGLPWEVARLVQDEVDRWADERRLRPVTCLSAYVIGIPLAPIDFAAVKAAVAGGVSVVWMPPVTSAYSMMRLGGRGAWFAGRPPEESTGPVSWDEARSNGLYVLDDHGRLLPAFRDTVRLVADHGVALSFGHLSPREMEALADECAALGYTGAFIDHPFSEVFEFDLKSMQLWADAGLHFVLTWDELSPLLGADPQDMVAAIRTVGAEHFALASDAGIPLLPDSVDAYMLLTSALRAYGVAETEMRTMMSVTPRSLVGQRLRC